VAGQTNRKSGCASRETMHIDSIVVCQCTVCAKLLSQLLTHIHHQHHPASTSPVQQSPPTSLQQVDLTKGKMEEKQKKMKKKQLTSDAKVSFEKKDEGSDSEVLSACIQQCTIEEDGQDELVMATKTLKILNDYCPTEIVTSKPLKDKPSPPESSTINRYRPSSSSSISHYIRTSEDDHIQQCKQVGQDELVVAAAAASSDNCYSQDYTHTIVCRYCREEVNSCYYEEHLVSCLESYQCAQGDCLDKMVQAVNNKHSQTTRGHISPDTRDNGISEFVVNCTATEESFNQLSYE